MELCEDPYIEMQGLSFSRGERVIFDKVDIAIPRGKVTGIMGPSGTGKTTLLKLIGAQLRPDRGCVLVDGENTTTMKRSKLFSVRKKMGMLFQSGALFTDLSVYENIAFPLRVHTDLSEALIRDMVLMKLHAVGLRGARDLMPSELSGGMARRVALARAIVLDPEMIMYDEPFVGQDPMAMGVLVQLIRMLNDALKLTSVIVSHDVRETASISDYIYVVGDTHVLGFGTPQQMLNSEDPRIRQFMQGLPDGPVPFQYPAKDYREDLLGSGDA